MPRSRSEDSSASVRTSSPRPLLKSWPAISRRVQAAEGVALFLDFDGTLVDFQPRPDQVKLAVRTSAALRKLTAIPNVRVTIVSGRRRSSLLRFIKVRKLRVSGLYGWEHQEGIILAGPAMRQVSRIRKLLATLERELPGIYVEDKGISFAVHFRDASQEVVGKAQRMLSKFLPRFRAYMRIIRAGNVWELTPRHVRGKGPAIRTLLRELPAKFLSFYVGDDLTDEPAFRALGKGISVVVGSRRPTNAYFSLPNPIAVCKFLELLSRELA